MLQRSVFSQSFLCFCIMFQFILKCTEHIVRAVLQERITNIPCSVWVRNEVVSEVTGPNGRVVRTNARTSTWPTTWPVGTHVTRSSARRRINGENFGATSFFGVSTGWQGCAINIEQSDVTRLLRSQRRILVDFECAPVRKWRIYCQICWLNTQESSSNEYRVGINQVQSCGQHSAEDMIAIARYAVGY